MKHNQFIFSIFLLVFFSLSSCERKSGRKNAQGFTQNNNIEQTRHITYDSNG
jgi:hypothetical protein